MPDKLIIFDYSGTLSFNAALFAAPKRLAAELQKSGLSALGINTPEIFWDEVVNPTWERGSTSGVGYKRVMAERIRELVDPGKDQNAFIEEAVARFAASYFKSFRIYPVWHPLLKKLPEFKDVFAIIPTDHYAEATCAILSSLQDIGINAVAVQKDATVDPATSFVVANSADLGYHKDDLRFWQMPAAFLGAARVKHILVIDDFGANEQQGDSYAQRTRVALRRERMTDLLREEFDAKVEVIPFIMEKTGGGEEYFEELAVSAVKVVERYIFAG